ncbi:unnamed protein product [Medioppia subpectinata]|uniref:Uncharacterized protein n=1 Tax=Medioppia subpectinata TaxID=1979941 RepID=A0A7R9KXH1_9ACAR|nr:unnamed protein product [Medioppia subpectinata]CAG2111295.1 unnamed protein product [Medioppia subpectinata]
MDRNTKGKHRKIALNMRNDENSDKMNESVEELRSGDDWQPIHAFTSTPTTDETNFYDIICIVNT